MEHVQTSINIELMVNVLTMGYWPTYTPMDVSLPEDVSRSLYLVFRQLFHCCLWVFFKWQYATKKLCVPWVITQLQQCELGVLWWPTLFVFLQLLFFCLCVC